VSAAFLRAVFGRGIRTVLGARAGAIASEFSMSAVRTAFPMELTQAHLRSLDLNMRRMEDRWRRRIEIEAKESEHADRITKLHLATLATGQTSQKENPFGAFVELNRQSADGTAQSVPGSQEEEAAQVLKDLLRDGRKPAAECVKLLNAEGYDLEKLNAGLVRRKAGADSKKFSGDRFYSWYLQSQLDDVPVGLPLSTCQHAKLKP
jgi:hypothetical protein